MLGRIAGLTLLPTGAVVVAEAQALELRAFDQRGAHLWSAGRGGEGPGEILRTISHFSRLGTDSMLASDASERTMVFGPDGTYARQLRLAEPREGTARLRIIGALGDGKLVAVYSNVVATSGEIPTGILRSSEVVGMLDSSGAVGEGMDEFRSPSSHLRSDNLCGVSLVSA